jgi:hypothetical protein
MRAPGALPAPVWIVAALFGAAVVWIVGASLVPPRVPTFVPVAPARGDTVTVDATDAAAWRFFSFTRGPLVPPDTAGWDLAVRRFRAVAAGAVARVDTPAFDAVREAPRTGYVATTYGRDTTNAALARWYRYDFFAHLLRPRPRTYVVRTRDGRHAKLQFLSYYCPGPTPGCVTFRYGVLPAPP